MHRVPSGSGEGNQPGDLLKSPNRQRVRELSSNATRIGQLVTVRVREVRVRALGERLRFGLPKIPMAGGQMSVRPPLEAVSGCGCEALRRTQTSLVLSLRRPRLTPRLNGPDGCRQPISVGHQYAKSSLSMIVRKLGGARTSSTTTTSPGHSAPAL